MFLRSWIAVVLLNFVASLVSEVQNVNDTLMHVHNDTFSSRKKSSNQTGHETVKELYEMLTKPVNDIDIGQTEQLHQVTVSVKVEDMTEFSKHEEIPSNKNVRAGSQKVTTVDDNKKLAENTEQPKAASSGCKEVNLAVICYVLTLGLFGITGNSISIRVLHKIKNKSSTSLLLSALAIWDSAFLVFTIVMEPVRALLENYVYVAAVQKVVVYLELYGYELMHVAQGQSTWVTGLVTFHRYIGEYFAHTISYFFLYWHIHARGVKNISPKNLIIPKCL